MADRPVLNPTLRLSMDPTPVPGVGRSKNEKSIKRERLDAQRALLSEELAALRESPARIARAAGKTLIVARMFSDSLAPSWTPTDLFSKPDCTFIAPLKSGYLIEVSDAALSRLSKAIGESTNAKVLTDVSRVRRVRPFGPKAIQRGRSVETLWSRGLERPNGSRLFTAWLMPFADEAARDELLEKFGALAQEGTAFLPSQGGPGSSLAVTTVGRALRDYRVSSGVGRAVIEVESKRRLDQLIASGTVFRIDPVQKIIVAASPSAKPSKAPVLAGIGPVVACIDGGMTDVNYIVAEAWRLPALISDGDADHLHGNAIASLVTHGGQLNPALNLPDLACRFGVVQAVPRHDASSFATPDDLYDLLTQLAVRHRDCRVWNLSFNLPDRDDEAGLMSDFGHQISMIARAAEVLPVISIGNTSAGAAQLLPPGDAEAALTVGGRLSNDGAPGNHCASCCSGPGPEGALKPDISWFSPVDVGSGASMVGSSFATALTSSLAAHTFERLRDPTPDLVKALMISRTERIEHNASLGWGTPYHGVAPWECEPGSVSMVWNAELETGYNYYWRDIPVPAEMIRAGRIVGAASLTAILEPLTSPFAGPNYFASRLEVSLQYQKPAGTWGNLLGTMKESTIEEEVARNELKKWQPVRHHKKDGFSHGMMDGGVLQVRARVYTRDLFQPGLAPRGGVPPQRVAFVLSLKGDDEDDGLYNSMVRGLGAYVSSAVLEQTVEIEAV